MRSSEVLKIFRDAGAILKGHFVLRSGLHSDTYFQKALAFQRQIDVDDLIEGLISLASFQKMWKRNHIDYIVSPSIGAIVPGAALARRLNVPFIYLDKDEKEHCGWKLGRGFKIKPGEKVIVLEDVVTTGRSVYGVADYCRYTCGAEVAAVCAILNRSNMKHPPSLPQVYPFIALASVKANTWEANHLPPDLKKVPITKL